MGDPFEVQRRIYDALCEVEVSDDNAAWDSARILAQMIRCQPEVAVIDITFRRGGPVCGWLDCRTLKVTWDEIKEGSGNDSSSAPPPVHASHREGNRQVPVESEPQFTILRIQ
jgi:hypothetical protein